VIFMGAAVHAAEAGVAVLALSAMFAGCSTQRAPASVETTRHAPALVSATPSPAPTNAGGDVIELRGAHGMAKIDIDEHDGAFTLTPTERREWIARAATAVSAFYGAFPAEQVRLVVEPVADRDRVVFGKTRSDDHGSTIVLFVGTRLPRTALDSDWVLVHELFHLGFPSLRGEGTWLEEGLATYAEPLIRARAGMLTEEQGWAEVIRDMPLGVELCETLGLEHYRNIRAVYWGGAVVALLADVAARRRAPRAPGLEQALRTMVADGWDSRRFVPPSEAIAAVDAKLGAPILASLAATYTDHGSPVPLDAVLSDLGIERRGSGVVLHDDAKLAAARRAIMYGEAEKDGGFPSRPISR
jgi:hypothetical protein